MTMNLDVSVRLLDGLIRPAANIDRALNGIGRSAAELVSHFSRLTVSVRGLTSATRELAGADTALGRATASGGRLRDGDVNIPVHAQSHHDARQIASLVHKKFDDATRAQLSDGAFA